MSILVLLSHTLDSNNSFGEDVLFMVPYTLLQGIRPVKSRFQASRSAFRSGRCRTRAAGTLLRLSYLKNAVRGL